MFNRSSSRKFGSSFCVLAASSSLISFSSTNNVFASEEFLNSNFLKALIDVIEDSDIEKFDCKEFWDNQSTTPGTNVEILKNESLLTLAELKKFAGINSREEYQKDEQKRLKVKAVDNDVDTVLLGDMGEKIREFFQSNFFKNNYKDVLNRYLSYNKDIYSSDDVIYGDFAFMKSFLLLNYEKAEDIADVLTSSGYKEIFCNKDGIYDKEKFNKNFTILECSYNLILKDFSESEKSKFREMYELGRAFNLFKSILKYKHVYDRQDLTDIFVLLIHHSKSLVEDQFLNFSDVLEVIEFLRSRIEEKLGIQKIMQFIEESKKCGENATKEVVYKMSEEYELIDKIIKEGNYNSTYIGPIIAKVSPQFVKHIESFSSSLQPIYSTYQIQP